MNPYNQLVQMRPMQMPMQGGMLYPQQMMGLPQGNMSVMKQQQQQFNQNQQKNGQSISKNSYSNIYHRALNDKIQQQLQRAQFEQNNGMRQYQQQSVSKGINQLTPSSELIEFVLNEYEQNYPVTSKPTNVKDSYTIYEDLKIIFSLGSSEDQITFSQYQKLADEKYINRSAESIKSRFQDYLKYLNKDDYQTILSYIDSNSLKGYLIFEKNDKGGRFLQRIQKQDPKSSNNNDSLNSSGVNNNNKQNGQQQQQQNKLSVSRQPASSLRSPMVQMNEELPVSPRLFSVSPSIQQQNNNNNNNLQYQNANPYFPYYMPGYPYQMYPQQQQQYMDGRMGQQSPFKPPMFFDPSNQQHAMMYAPPPQPYYMNPYMFNQMQQQYQPQYYNQQFMQNEQQLQNENNNDENNQVQFEVRPSLKKSSTKQQTNNNNEMEDEEAIHENISKKKKISNSQIIKKTNAQSIPLSEPKQQQLQQQSNKLLKPIISKAMEVENNNNNNVNSNNQLKQQQHQPQKIQTTLVLPKQFQGLQIQTPQFFNKQNGMMINESELKQQTNVMNKVLTKEVYDLISDDDRIPEDQFEYMMEYVAVRVKLTKERVIDILDSLSGSFKDLSVYLETKQENMLWNQEEDKILAQIKSQDSSEYKLLVKLKGIPSIKKRIIYNNLQLPFRII